MVPPLRPVEFVLSVICKQDREELVMFARKIRPAKEVGEDELLAAIQIMDVRTSNGLNFDAQMSSFSDRQFSWLCFKTGRPTAMGK